MQNNNKHTGFKGWMRNKGYYIVLVLCIAAVGISGYLYFNQSAAPDADAAPTAALQTPNAPAQEETGKDAASPSQEAAPPKLKKPVDGAVAQSFATDHLAYNATTKDWRVHPGVDLTASVGDAVRAAADGTVSAVAEDDFLGWTVELTHDGGYTTRYCNLAAEIPVAVGDQVQSGSQIGTIGTTAKLELASEPHLHFEVSQGTAQLNPETCFAE